MKELSPGMPIMYLDAESNNSFPGCIMDNDMFMYLYSDGNYYTGLIKDNKLEINDKSMQMIDLYAKVIEIDTSIRLYGSQQRKEEVHGSALRVVRFELQESGQHSFILATDRLDGISLRFDAQDIDFLFPTVYHSTHVATIFKKDDKVQVIKNSRDCGIQKGEKYKVTKAIRDDRISDMDILYLKNIEDRSLKVAYSKYFKAIK